MQAAEAIATEAGSDTQLAGVPAKAALLRGTQRGLEVVVDATAPLDAIVADITKWLDKAPGFFKGSDVRLRIDNGALPAGALGRIDGLAQCFDLRIVEVTAFTPVTPVVSAPSQANAVPQANLAAGSAPTTGFEEEITNSAIDLATLGQPPALPEEPTMLADEPSFDEPTGTNLAPLRLAATPEAEVETTSGVRTIIGPVRSGVILEHTGHLIVFGDVNPGAEVRCTGNIVVLGRLRGTAHAGIGQELGFILALRLEPQQLRIGRKVARAGDDASVTVPEIAYLTNEQIVVETYQGKLPRNFASSI